MVVAPRRLIGIASLLALGLAAQPPHAGAGPRRGEKLDDARKVDPDDAQAQEAAKYYQFGNQFLNQALLSQAEESLRRALSLQPVYPEASYLLAAVLYGENDFRGAIAEADKAVQQNPFLTEAHGLMGNAYAKMGDSERAIKEFEIVKADVSFPTPEVADFNIGRIFWEKQACGEAVIHFRKALDVNPGWGRAWYMLGDCQEQLGQMDLARSSYEKSLHLQPNDVPSMYRLGYTCFQAHDWACARQQFQKVRELSPGSDMGLGAREYLKQMDFR